jgi:hypothetical protein
LVNRHYSFTERDFTGALDLTGAARFHRRAQFSPEFADKTGVSQQPCANNPAPDPHWPSLERRHDDSPAF